MRLGADSFFMCTAPFPEALGTGQRSGLVARRHRDMIMMWSSENLMCCPESTTSDASIARPGGASVRVLTGREVTSEEIGGGGGHPLPSILLPRSTAPMARCDYLFAERTMLDSCAPPPQPELPALVSRLARATASLSLPAASSVPSTHVGNPPTPSVPSAPLDGPARTPSARPPRASVSLPPPPPPPPPTPANRTARTSIAPLHHPRRRPRRAHGRAGGACWRSAPRAPGARWRRRAAEVAEPDADPLPRNPGSQSSSRPNG